MGPRELFLSGLCYPGKANVMSRAWQKLNYFKFEYGYWLKRV
jgi:hypothetical protein